ncbi:hypothetical protein YC2023_094338 [Brassica napus]
MLLLLFVHAHLDCESLNSSPFVPDSSQLHLGLSLSQLLPHSSRLLLGHFLELQAHFPPHDHGESLHFVPSDQSSDPGTS